MIEGVDGLECCSCIYPVMTEELFGVFSQTSHITPHDTEVPVTGGLMHHISIGPARCPHCFPCVGSP